MSKKGEARVARRVAEQISREAKSARLRAEPDAHAVRSEYVKEASKEVRTGANPGSIFQMQMCWTVEDADRHGAWSWGTEREWTDEVWATALHPKLLEFEKLTWAEIESHAYGNEGKRHRSNHSMDTDKVCEEAQYRLIELDRDPEVLFRFRLGNLPRLWGQRVVNKFEIIWYDPTHQIYPVD
jgi:hypothetical protein